MYYILYLISYILFLYTTDYSLYNPIGKEEGKGREEKIEEEEDVEEQRSTEIYRDRDRDRDRQ